MIRRTLLALLTAAGLLCVGSTVAESAQAATPGAVANLHVSTPAPTSSTIDIGWNATAGATSYQVSRTNPTPTYTGTTTKTHFQFTLLSPGASYTFTVAAMVGTAVGPKASITLKTTGGATKLTLVSSSLVATNGTNPINANLFDNSPTPTACYYYHWYNAICGGVVVNYSVAGETAAQLANDEWQATATLGRTFGCMSGNTFHAVKTVSIVRSFRNYPTSPAASGYLFYDFNNDASWDGAGNSDFPPYYACPAGSQYWELGVHMTNASLQLINVSTFAPDGPVLAVPGQAYS